MHFWIFYAFVSFLYHFFCLVLLIIGSQPLDEAQIYHFPVDSFAPIDPLANILDFVIVEHVLVVDLYFQNKFSIHEPLVHLCQNALAYLIFATVTVTLFLEVKKFLRWAAEECITKLPLKCYVKLT